ncbi:hypothetical protein Q7C_2735 (plasmid) [Methylophaga frappieri]|jgi:hypothetical protein|uniref:Uncharacterized protein n=1 Tax=Methylophaga frappieri (strain ATCC BAA-2434 / DSM 25690 / JAM7) TaxID=754477 RepID=I1YLR2_METFJ|nr:hypothetical protein [Methylophaga frappieri]AFJ03855.1 hypothetical protein Q7C_2735 [Methylophaga frappieri]EJL9283278.1 hypothetical protein [Salmonella enterica]HCG9146954.1 hypothetical protein [Vibrio parahaemolyticus]|tara:strand:+ start:1544 stop:1792 length:249 start_codon:yes stop_codon:yes gene_type:complete
MDYYVPSVEKILESGTDYIDGRYEVARAAQIMWERWEVLDDRAIAELQVAIEHLSQLKEAIRNVLDDNGNYNWSDNKEGDKP